MAGLSVLTLSTPPIETIGGPEDAAELARVANDELKKICEGRPDTFLAWVEVRHGQPTGPSRRRARNTDVPLLMICFSHSTSCYNRSRSRRRPSVRTSASGAIALIASCSAARF